MNALFIFFSQWSLPVRLLNIEFRGEKKRLVRVLFFVHIHEVNINMNA